MGKKYSESDYQAFIEGLRIVRQRYPFSLYAYVLMSNHFHLLGARRARTRCTR